MYLEFLEQMKDAQPTTAHQLSLWLHEKGWLHRVFTQNVDGLYQKAGLPEEMVVEFHGSFLKGDIVMSGDGISHKVLERVNEDLIEQHKDIDLVIVMGTSLQVAPFLALPNIPSKKCCRVLVDKQPQNCYTNNWTPKRSSIMEMCDYQNNSILTTTMKLGNRKISLQAQWNPRGKWKNQHIITSDCDAWSEQIIQSD